jgi:hypothetical protein
VVWIRLLSSGGYGPESGCKEKNGAHKKDICARLGEEM